MQNQKPSAEVQAAVMQLWNVLHEARQNILSLEEEKLLLAKKNEKLEEQLQQHAVAAGKLQTYIEHLQAESREQLKQNDSLQENLKSALDQARNNETTIAALREELKTHQTILSAQQTELEQITHQKTEIQTLYELVDEKETELITVRQELVNTHEQIAAFSKELAEQQRQNQHTEQLQQDLDIVRAELVRRNTEINMRYNEIIEYKDRATELESRLLKAEQVILSASNEAKETDELRRALQELQVQHQALVQFEDEETEETMVLQEQVVELNRILDEQSALLHKREEEIQNLNAQLQTFTGGGFPTLLTSVSSAEKEQLTQQIRLLAEKIESAILQAE